MSVLRCAIYLRRASPCVLTPPGRTDAFYGVEDNPALANVDVMTDVSMAPTAFTRYTVAPTSASRSSRCAAPPPLIVLFR